MVFLGLYLVSAFLLELLYDFCSSNIHHIHLCTSLLSLSFLVTNNFFLPTLLFSIFLHALLLVCYGAVVLFLFLALLQIHRFDLSLVPVLSQLITLYFLVFSSLITLVSLPSWLLLCPPFVLFLFFPLSFPSQSIFFLLTLLLFVPTQCKGNN